MSDDEADSELLDLLKRSLGLSLGQSTVSPETGVLASAEHVCNNSIDVALDMAGTKAAAALIYNNMRARGYSTQAWSQHELHPKTKDEAALNFIFTMDLLNFSFFSDKIDPDDPECFAIEYRGKRWKGYWSLCAALQRALDEGLYISSPSAWHREAGYSDDVLRHVFRSATSEPMPMLDARIKVLREAADVLFNHFDMKVVNLIKRANNSAAALVNLLAAYFLNFGDEIRFEGRMVRFLKRAQIFVADVWACFDGQGYGRFDDIDKITMFADYRIPQILHTLGALTFSPPLESVIRKQLPIKAGSTWEIEIRGCSIHAVELIRREIAKMDPDTPINAILIDFFLYDTMKELERTNADRSLDVIPHHRTRSIWY
ncbi:uncharacterized protein PV09_02997 [Verruconis gallopava]|uniref:Queuosine 5'-phosphate N-glycosylase/hydrolase n=1 Tax=Verruconis gallopava TaxID=253628 RepID=A0A0D2AI85_9PEZI|nr:uncharacterized protein PV09_02997 [Verruconis gallopava]KIW06568.1 hypothetical protein PV09_02997 [Verruconis gallopava]